MPCLCMPDFKLCEWLLSVIPIFFFVLILFKYVLLYLGKRYLCHAFACLAFYSLSTTLTLDRKYVTQGRVRITYTTMY
jgi:hypothetical protein